MAKNYVQVEVLLVTGTNFLAGNWIKKDDTPAGRPLSEIDQLQEACWNGLLETMSHYRSTTSYPLHHMPFFRTRQIINRSRRNDWPAIFKEILQQCRE